MLRTKLVPFAVLALSLATIGAISLVQGRADASRDAQLQLATLKIELVQLQGAPFASNARTGGSPEIAAKRMKDGKKRVAATLAQLRSDSPAPALARIAGPLKANYAALDRIYEIGSSGADFGPEADRLAGVAAGAMGAVAGALTEATRDYDQRSSASSKHAAAGSASAILLLALAFVFFYRAAVRARAVAEHLAREKASQAVVSHEEARTDALTGLPNRRALNDDLESGVPVPAGNNQVVLAIFDLDGFKQYNDTFGHSAGDALLARLGERLSGTVDGLGTAYRMGGDEFCVVASVVPGRAETVISLAADALSEVGDAFTIGCSYGLALVPADAPTHVDALLLADQRMYDQKAGRTSASRQSTDVLLKVLSERSTDLREHLEGVARLARQTAERLGLPEHEVKLITVAAELHDVGKTAIPDAILNKPGPLDEDEWSFMRRHTVIGERIILAAPSLAPAATLVRSSHERFDGTGYPDALAGDAIPLGAGIIAVCDAFDAMISERPYRPALSTRDALTELRRCSGEQFDPHVVDAVCALVAENELAPSPV